MGFGVADFCRLRLQTEWPADSLPVCPLVHSFVAWFEQPTLPQYVGQLMLCIYVGDSGDVLRRLRRDHRGGNVEASALRRHIAEAMGFTFTRTIRSSGSTRIRIAPPHERTGELAVTAYLHSGHWKYVLCDSYAEASEFQWFTIDRLAPLTNRRHGSWLRAHRQRHEALLSALEGRTFVDWSCLDGLESGPGVYVLYHEVPPA
jgi:hypothetical protein